MKKIAFIGALIGLGLGIVFGPLRSCASPEAQVQRKLDQLESALSYTGSNPSNIKKMAALQSILGLMHPEVSISVSSQSGEQIQANGKDSIRDIYMAARMRAESLAVKFGLRAITLHDDSHATVSSEALVRASPGSRVDAIAVEMEWERQDGSWVMRSVKGSSNLRQ